MNGTLPLQTFASPPSYWISGYAHLSTFSYSGSDDYPHSVVVRDKDDARVVALHLTTAGAVDLRDFLTALLEAEAVRVAEAVAEQVSA